MVEKLFLIWNAEMSLAGGLQYVASRLRGTEECALCELTYDGLAERPKFKECKRDLGLPFEGVYRNRMDDEQVRAAGADIPCVLGKTPTGLVKLLGQADIEDCNGDLDRFADKLRDAIDHAPP